MVSGRGAIVVQEDVVSSGVVDDRMASCQVLKKGRIGAAVIVHCL